MNNTVEELIRSYSFLNYINEDKSHYKHAKDAGFQEMVLDTIESLQSAIHLYHQFGFEECVPYYDNPMEDVIYMKKDLL